MTATATLTATLRPATGNSPPGVLLQLTWTGPATALVQRLDPDGRWTPVRTGEPASLAGGSWTTVDYEMPYAQAVYYQATADSSTAQPATGAVIVPDQGRWLIHPGVPARSVPLAVWRMPQRARAARQTTFQPLGRATPLIRSQPRQSATYPGFQVRTFDQPGIDDLDLIVDDGSALLLNWPPDSTGVLSGWVSVGDVTEDRRSDYGADPVRVWTLPLTVVTRPAGGQQGVWNYTAAAAAYSTYSALAAAFTSNNDLAADEPAA